jgi:hypothetical protein
MENTYIPRIWRLKPTLKNELRFSKPVLMQAYILVGVQGVKRKGVRYLAVKRPTNRVRWWVG